MVSMTPKKHVGPSGHDMTPTKEPKGGGDNWVGGGTPGWD